MAKILVKPPVEKLSDRTIEFCNIIDSYIKDNDIDGFSVDVKQDGEIDIALSQPSNMSFVFSV